MLPIDPSSLQGSISILENDSRVLEKSSASWELWLPFFTTLVAIGVAMEIWVVLRDHKKETEEWRICILRPEGPTLVKLLLEVTSVILVTVGILGELGDGLWISHLNGQLRTNSSELRSESDQLLALVTQEAGVAKRSANDAWESARQANSDAQNAKDKAEAVGKEADQAKAKIAALDQLAGTIGLQVATAEYVLSARLVLDQDGLTNDLRSEFKGRDIAFRSYIGDAEAAWLCDQLIRIADNAAVHTRRECGMEPLSNFPVEDLLIRGAHEEAMHLSQILKKPQRVPGVFVGLSEAPELTVFVGVKRSFPLQPQAEKQPQGVLNPTSVGAKP